VLPKAITFPTDAKLLQPDAFEISGESKR